MEGDETVVQVPTNPAPNTTYEGQSSDDQFRYIFNEQIRNPDGSITVNAAHQIFLGPSAVGDLHVGQSVCGVTVPPDTVPPAAPSKPDLTAASDTGASTTDNLTKDTTPTFTGTAEANSTVELFEGTTSRAPAGTAPVSASGTWSVTLNGVAPGPHTYTATATDAAGNASSSSEALEVSIDTGKPRVSNTTSPTTPTANLTAKFSERMNPTTINGTSTTPSKSFKLYRLVKRSDGTIRKVAVAASVIYKDTTTTSGTTISKATLNPTDSLLKGNYEARVTPAALDLAGNALDQNPTTTTTNDPKRWRFTI